MGVAFKMYSAHLLENKSRLCFNTVVEQASLPVFLLICSSAKCLGTA